MLYFSDHTRTGVSILTSAAEIDLRNAERVSNMRIDIHILDTFSTLIVSVILTFC